MSDSGGRRIKRSGSHRHVTSIKLPATPTMLAALQAHHSCIADYLKAQERGSLLEYNREQQVDSTTPQSRRLNAPPPDERGHVSRLPGRTCATPRDHPGHDLPGAPAAADRPRMVCRSRSTVFTKRPRPGPTTRRSRPTSSTTSWPSSPSSTCGYSRLPPEPICTASVSVEAEPPDDAPGVQGST